MRIEAVTSKNWWTITIISRLCVCTRSNISNDCRENFRAEHRYPCCILPFNFRTAKISSFQNLETERYISVKQQESSQSTKKSISLPFQEETEKEDLPLSSEGYWPRSMRELFAKLHFPYYKFQDCVLVLRFHRSWNFTVKLVFPDFKWTDMKIKLDKSYTRFKF